MKWHLVMFLHQWPSRKTWALYVSIKEFQTHLQPTEAWITICVVRSSIVNTLDGNLSQLLKILLHHWSTTHMIHLAGIQLFEPPGQPQCIPHKRLFLSLGFFIMDGAAHKYAFSIKGDSGSRFCCLCKKHFPCQNPAIQWRPRRCASGHSQLFHKGQPFRLSQQWWDLVQLVQDAGQERYRDCQKL